MVPSQGTWPVVSGAPSSSGQSVTTGGVNMSVPPVPPTPTPPLGTGGPGTVPSPGPQNLMMNMQPPPAVGSSAAQPQSLPTQFMAAYPQPVQHHHPGGIPIPMAPPGVSPHPNVAGNSTNAYSIMSPQPPGAPQTVAMQHHILSMQQQYMSTQSMYMQ